MSFKYKFGLYPGHNIEDISRAAERLQKKLTTMQLGQLEIGEQIYKFFDYKINSLDTNLIKYSHQLSWAIAGSSKPKEEIVIIDHGGGTGLFGMLCKEYGIGTVIYNDINKEWTHDAQILGEAVGLASEHYIAGDIDELLTHIKSNDLECDALVSYNTIEHVYNMKELIERIAEIPGENLTVYMSTGANWYNPSIRKTIVPLQVRAEFGEGDTGMFDGVKCYFQQRKELIEQYKPGFSDDELSKLSASSRGMMYTDIHKLVDSYLEKGVIPPPPKHKTNTGDPQNGYWCEHFMDPYELKGWMQEVNFKTRVIIGFYGRPRSKVRRLIASTLNLLIRIFGTKAISISSFWTLYGQRVSKA